MSNTVDALKNLYKTLCGSDYAGDPNPTDAEMIDAIAKDASSGSGGSSGIVITMRQDTSQSVPVFDSLDPGLTFDDLSKAVVHGYISDELTRVYNVLTVDYGENDGSYYYSLLIFIQSNTAMIVYSPETGELIAG